MFVVLRQFYAVADASTSKPLTRTQARPLVQILEERAH